MPLTRFTLCFTGPSVKRMEGTPYRPNMFEGVGDQVLNYISWFYAIAKFFSPFLIVYATRRGLLYPETWRNASHEQIRSLQSIVLIAAFTTTGAYVLRGLGRRFNSEYDVFLGKLRANERMFLARSDFQFSHAPVEYAAPARSEPSAIRTKLGQLFKSPVRTLLELPMQFISYTFAHTIGIRMLYPGSTGIFNSLTSVPRDEKRREMQLEYGGLRLALLTDRGHRVETMFIDRRNKTTNGNTLVVCCEGNAGFLELGTVWTPLQMGYSVLSWNHAGFGGSDGDPFPDNERASIDAIMQYVTQRAGFEPQQIVLLGWSIGGYTASLGAKLYPDIKCLIMDAVFDRLDELAVAKMPQWMSGFVVQTVRSQVNLDNFKHLKDYNGPVRFIRRTNDEMISTDDANRLETNRVNGLVVSLLQTRYPAICDDGMTAVLYDYLYNGSSYAEAHTNDFNARMKRLSDMLEPLARRRAFPIDEAALTEAGVKLEEPGLQRQLTLFLIRSHLEDFRSTHNAQLPTSHLTFPWST